MRNIVSGRTSETPNTQITNSKSKFAIYKSKITIWQLPKSKCITKLSRDGRQKGGVAWEEGLTLSNVKLYAERRLAATEIQIMSFCHRFRAAKILVKAAHPKF